MPCGNSSLKPRLHEAFNPDPNPDQTNLGSCKRANLDCNPGYLTHLRMWVCNPD